MNLRNAEAKTARIRTDILDLMREAKEAGHADLLAALNKAYIATRDFDNEIEFLLDVEHDDALSPLLHCNRTIRLGATHEPHRHHA